METSNIGDKGKSNIEGTVHIATGSKLGFHSVGTAADGTSLWDSSDSDASGRGGKWVRR